MSNSTTNLDLLVSSQTQKEVTANALFDASSPSMIYGRRANACSGLVWGYYGGLILTSTGPQSIANGTLTLTASSTNYVMADPATGAVSFNTTGFVPGKVPLYSCVAGPATITSYSDQRLANKPVFVKASIALSGAATLTQSQAASDRLVFTGTAGDVTVPAYDWQWTVFNNTASSITVKTASGTGIAVAAGKRAILECDGVNVNRLAADI